MDKPAIEKGEVIVEFTQNSRKIVLWSGVSKDGFNIGLFNQIGPTNEFSQDFLTPWGFMTHFVDFVEDFEEVTDLVRLYTKDIKDQNYWWEID